MKISALGFFMLSKKERPRVGLLASSSSSFVPQQIVTSAVEVARCHHLLYHHLCYFQVLAVWRTNALNMEEDV